MISNYHNLVYACSFTCCVLKKAGCQVKLCFFKLNISEFKVSVIRRTICHYWCFYACVLGQHFAIQIHLLSVLFILTIVLQNVRAATGVNYCFTLKRWIYQNKLDRTCTDSLVSLFKVIQYLTSFLQAQIWLQKYVDTIIVKYLMYTTRTGSDWT